MKVTFLNGPPRSGKDFTGELLTKNVDGMKLLAGPAVRVDKFARKLKEAAHALYGVMPSGRVAPHTYFESFKDTPRSEFFGKTPRAVYIAVSETYMKVMHGDRIFGEMLLCDLPGQLIDELIITDSGFRGEAEVFIERFGAANCRLVRLHREGCTYGGDSRSYLDLADLGVKCIDVTNPGEKAGLLAELTTKLNQW